MQQEEQISLVAYDPAWPVAFEAEKILIACTIGAWIVGGIHHVGSTAVPNLSAKPIIDIMVGVRNLEEAQPCLEILRNLQYCYYPYKPQQMHWFCKPSPSRRTHHLYLMETAHPQWQARLAFRDYLRCHPDVRIEYETLKRLLAEKFRDDREGYTNAKTSFIENIVAKALGREVAFE